MLILRLPRRMPSEHTDGDTSWARPLVHVGEREPKVEVREVEARGHGARASRGCAVLREEIVGVHRHARDRALWAGCG